MIQKWVNFVLKLVQSLVIFESLILGRREYYIVYQFWDGSKASIITVGLQNPRAKIKRIRINSRLVLPLLCSRIFMWPFQEKKAHMWCLMGYILLLERMTTWPQIRRFGRRMGRKNNRVTYSFLMNLQCFRCECRLFCMNIKNNCGWNSIYQNHSIIFFSNHTPKSLNSFKTCIARAYILVYNKEVLAYVRLWPWWVPIVILSK